MSKKQVVKGKGHAIPGQVVSWVGECPWTETLGFGTESGHFMAKTTSAPTDHMESIHVAYDSVNGVAFSDRIAAFTSRSSVLIAKQVGSGNIEVTPLLQRDEGAHGVVAATSGEFLMPCGSQGIVIIATNGDGSAISHRRAQLHDNPLNGYGLWGAFCQWAFVPFDEQRVGFHPQCGCAAVEGPLSVVAANLTVADLCI